MTDKIQAVSKAQTAASTTKTQQTQTQVQNPYMTSIFNPMGSLNTDMMSNVTNNMYSTMMSMNTSSPFADFGLQSNMNNWYSAIANCLKFDFSKIDYSQYASNFNMGNPNMPQFGGLTGVNGATNPAEGVESTEHKIVIAELQAKGVASTGDLAKDKAALDEAKKSKSSKDKEVAQICNDLYDAMKGAGTKNDKLKAAVSKINKDNILDVMSVWNNNFASDMGDETLMEAIANECYWGWFSNQQKDLTTHLQKALKEKAEELELNSEAAAFDSKVNYEKNHWWNTDDEVVVAQFNELYAKAINADNEVLAKKVVIAQNTPIPQKEKKDKE